MMSSMRSFSSSEMRTVTTDNVVALMDRGERLDFFLQFFLAVAISELHRHCRDLCGGNARLIPEAGAEPP